MRQEQKHNVDYNIKILEWLSIVKATHEKPFGEDAVQLPLLWTQNTMTLLRLLKEEIETICSTMEHFPV